MSSHCFFEPCEHEGAIDLVALEHHQRIAAGFGGMTDKGGGEFVGDVDGLDQNVLAFFYGAGIADKHFG